MAENRHEQLSLGLRLDNIQVLSQFMMSIKQPLRTVRTTSKDSFRGRGHKKHDACNHTGLTIFAILLFINIVGLQ